ncbi:MAG: thioredoxin fold domain-containing protein [Phycisphaera sp.]|nr:thioredoxin fold domain-containing protein [Phycisphaera sp.]
MKIRTLLVAVVTLAAVAGILAGPNAYAKKKKKAADDNAAAASVESGWTEVYDDAVAESKKTNKPILADFTGSDWCGWCIKLHKEVFSTDEFKAWAKDHVVLLTVDFPNAKPQSKEIKQQNKALEKKYKIEGYPTILFLDAEGKKLGESGYEEGGPKVWIAIADKILAKAKK